MRPAAEQQTPPCRSRPWSNMHKHCFSKHAHHATAHVFNGLLQEAFCIHAPCKHGGMRPGVMTCDANRYTLLLHGIEFNTKRHLRCKFLMVTHGILAQQYTLAERGLQPPPSFEGVISYAGMSVLMCSAT